MISEWIHNDICWCISECDNKECFRHPSNRNPEFRIFTAAGLKGSDLCPLIRKDEENEVCEKSGS